MKPSKDLPPAILDIILVHGVDPGSLNNYRVIKSILETAKNQTGATHVKISELLKLLAKHSKQWDQQIDLIVNSQE